MKTRKQDNAEALKWIEKITRLMDSKFIFPGTRFRFGLDPILGLLPGIGDAAALAISGGLVMTMIRFGASRKVIILMVMNVLLDATIGSIPILGNIFDFFYKANTRNLNLLKAHYREGRHQGSGKSLLITVALVFILTIGLIIWGIWELAEWLVEGISQI